jgi:hypothetical protein
MALTMWGEGRGEGEPGDARRRHVIHNRWQAKRHGAFVTDTSAKRGRSAPGTRPEPNRDGECSTSTVCGGPGSRDHRLWLDG